ncbi:MAG: MerR family transcriptional regulator [Candidatus Sericytochromatia bacterium]|nr:MerR family transcriptional regulator [Candidatus Sericytochromatia bacterium]
MRTDDAPIYTIKSVAQLTGLPTETIRAWERRYQVVAPQRSGGGHRLYRASDVDRLTLLQRAVQAGHTIGQVARVPSEELGPLLVTPAPREAVVRSLPESAVADRVLEALVRYDQAGAARELESAATLLPARSLLHEAVLPLLARIEEGWERGVIGIAQEHMASSILRGLLGNMMRLAETRPDRPSAILATPPGDLHELGLLCVGLLMAGRGMAVTYLGPQVPARDLVHAARVTEARIVGLGIGIVTDRTALLGELDHLAAELPKASQIWLGGRGVVALSVERLPPRCRFFPTLTAVETEVDAWG